MKPYYEQDGVTLYHGDCREVLPSLSGIDTVLTDPPYELETASRRIMDATSQGVLFGPTP